MIESRDQTTYSHSSHKCSARGSNQHWPELYHDATRQGTVKLGCSYAKWRWVHYLHGSSSSRELICLAQEQHGAASATVIDPSEIDNDAYCVCTHDFSLCTHKKFRPVRTMYAVKISGTLTVFGFMRTQIKIPLKLKQTGNFSSSFVWLLCQQSEK